MKKISILLCLFFILNNCSTKKQDIASDNSYIVTSKKGINLRNAPERTSSIIFLIPTNEEVTVIKQTEKNDSIDGINSPWYYIQYKTYNGWVFGGYIQKTSERKIIISKSGIGIIKIGDSFDSIVAYIKPESIEKNEDGTWTLNKNNKPLIRICDSNYGKDKTLVWAEIYSDMFELTEGIHVGSSIEDLLAKFPCTGVDYDVERGTAYFNITQISNYKEAFKTIILYVESNDDKSIIAEDFNKNIPNEKPLKFQKNGKVECILIHK